MLDLLAVLSNRDYYHRFKPFIKDYAVPKEASMIINSMEEYYRDNPTVTDIDVAGAFSTWFLVLKYSTLKPDKVKIFQEIFKNVEKARMAPSTTTAEDIIATFVERDFATRLADTALRVAEGDTKVNIDKCEGIIDEYKSESKRVAKNETLITTDFSKLYAPTTEGLDWRLDCLNKALGPLRKGDFVVVGKLPESGGTAFAVSEMTHMLTQIKPEQRILYFGNEERGEAIRKRVISAILNRNNKYVASNPVPAASDFLAAGGDRIEIHGVHGRNIYTIERIIKACKEPALIVIDQLWKVQSYDKNANDVTRITNLFVKARALASEYAPVIAIHQGDGSAYGDVYMDMSQLYMSRIGIQGEADAIITIGVDPAGPVGDTTRYINIPKNKLEGGRLSEERFRHSKWEVQIIPEVSRYKDL